MLNVQFFLLQYQSGHISSQLQSSENLYEFIPIYRFPPKRRLDMKMLKQ